MPVAPFIIDCHVMDLISWIVGSRLHNSPPPNACGTIQKGRLPLNSDLSWPATSPGLVTGRSGTGYGSAITISRASEYFFEERNGAIKTIETGCQGSFSLTVL